MFPDDSRVQGDSNHAEVTIMNTVHPTSRTYHNGGRARWLALALAACVLAVGNLIADRSWAHELDVVAVSNVYKPGCSAARGGRGGNAQAGEQWSGTVAVPDPLGLQLAPDVYEFDVLEGYDNDRMSVAIAWDAGLAVAYDLDLFVDRLDGGQWVRVGSSTNGLSSLHVIYMVPADGVDEELDLDGTLDAAMASMNAWFLRETPGRQLRLDVFGFPNGSSALDITFVRGEKTQAEYAAHADGVFVAITDELEQRGWNDDPGLKRYLVHYGGPAESTNVCGTAYYNTLGTDYAQWSVVFLDAATGCGAREFGTPEMGAGRSEPIAVQEMLHNDYYEHPAPWNDLSDSPFFEP